MNSPYQGKFYISQGYYPAKHDGLDLVGVDDKNIHATQKGVIHYAGWENPNNHSQGFGQYVCIKGVDGLFYYYGHLSKISVRLGQSVNITDVIGVEGSTGYSTGSHCHYEVRKAFYKGAEVIDVCALSGIPNFEGGTFDDGYRPGKSKEPDIKALQTALNAHGYDCGAADGIIGKKTTAAMVKALCDIYAI
jgi:murein DD-endopeptidase MepM/ murein hydrolase activator NlpD